MSRVVALLLLSVLVSMPVRAERVSVHGLGAKTCASFVYALTSLDKDLEFNRREIAQYLGWANGYLTALSLTVDTSGIKGRSGDEKLIWLRDYCGRNPDDAFHLAVASMAGSFGKTAPAER